MTRSINRNSANEAQAGFTLIELSIVLVIIGLIVGGILIGQDMIKSAELRATVTQLERYSAAVNTFRSKYNGLPGDLANYSNFNFQATGRTGGAGLGDGNALLQSCDPAANPGYFCGENKMFWSDLATANMIAESTTGAATAAAAAVTAANLPTQMPLAKMGKSTFITVASTTGLNYYLISGLTAVAASGAPTLSDTITPQEAFQIDTKMDDGIPNRGIVVAATDVANLDAGAATGALAAADCWDSTLNIFATNTDVTRDVNGCRLRARMGN